MATQEDVRRIALSLPQAREHGEGFAFGVFSQGKTRRFAWPCEVSSWWAWKGAAWWACKGAGWARWEGFAWEWNERAGPDKPAVPNPEVLLLRVASPAEKEELLAADPAKFFTDRDTGCTVLVRLPAVDAGELAELITGAWRQVPPRTRRRFEFGRLQPSGCNRALGKAVSSPSVSARPAPGNPGRC